MKALSLYIQMYAQHAITTERLENTFYCKFSAKVIITTSYFGKSLLVSSKICDISVSVKQEITWIHEHIATGRHTKG